MNKRGLAIIIIVVVLITLCILEQVYIDNVLTTVNNRIEQFETIVLASDRVDSENIKTTIEELDEYWTKQESLLCTIIDHRNMKEVGEFIVKAKTSAEQNDKDEVIKSIDLIKYYVEGYDHIMRINFQNVF